MRVLAGQGQVASNGKLFAAVPDLLAVLALATVLSEKTAANAVRLIQTYCGSV